jgi:hypothetical protein
VQEKLEDTELENVRQRQKMEELKDEMIRYENKMKDILFSK